MRELIAVLHYGRRKYLDGVGDLCHQTDTNCCEAANQRLSRLAPKNKDYSQSASYLQRVAATVCEINSPYAANERLWIHDDVLQLAGTVGRQGTTGEVEGENGRQVLEQLSQQSALCAKNKMDMKKRTKRAGKRSRTAQERARSAYAGGGKGSRPVYCCEYCKHKPYVRKGDYDKHVAKHVKNGDAKLPIVVNLN